MNRLSLPLPSRSPRRAALHRRLRRGSAADLPRSAAERPDDRRRESQLGGHPGSCAAGACGTAAERRPRARLRQPVRRDDQDRSEDRRLARFWYGGHVSVSQPLYRYANWIAYDEAKQQVSQADYLLAIAQQDLILRVAQAYFDVLLAQFNIELTAQPEGGGVRTARAGEAQFRGRRRDDHRHQRGAGEVRLDRRAGNRGAQRPTTTRCTALRAIIGAIRPRAQAVGTRLRADAAPTPNRSTTGSTTR